MSVEALDRMNGILDADLRVFTGDTMSRLGALQDENPSEYAGLRDAAEGMKKTLIEWRRGYRNTIKAGSPSEPVRALIDAGGRLHDALKQINGAVRKASPSAVRQWIQIAGGTVAGVAGDIAVGVQAVGRATIEAGKETLVLVKWLPWILAGGALLWFLAPRLLTAGVQGYRRRKEEPAV